jgi:5-methylcytosine-specific restriction endonuclease McrA
LVQLHRWQKVRRAHLRKQPLCEACFAKGKTVPATVADHVVPHGGDWNQFWIGELQSLCAAYHNGDKQSLDRTGRPRVTIGADGWPVA